MDARGGDTAVSFDWLTEEWLCYFLNNFGHAIFLHLILQISMQTLISFLLKHTKILNIHCTALGQHSEELWMIQGSRVKARPRMHLPRHTTLTEAEQSQRNDCSLTLNLWFQKAISAKQVR